MAGLKSQQVSLQNGWGWLAFSCLDRAGPENSLYNQVVGGSVGAVAGVFIRGPGLISGHSCMDGIGYISKHQSAGPL